MTRGTQRRRFWPARWVLVALAELLARPGLNSAVLAPAEQRGKDIYFLGRGVAGGAITAHLANANAVVPAAVFTCASCHGSDGRGNAEGTVHPSDITWDTLGRPREITVAGGRRHPGYTAAQVKRAITMGLDSGGNPLDPEMPRYQLTQDQADDLVAYLQRLGLDRDPGIASGAVRVGVLLSGSPDAAAVNAAVTGVLREFFADLNRRGGIYNREVVLEFGVVPDGPAAQAVAARRFLAEHDIFALLASFLALSEPDVGAVVREKEIPLVGPFCPASPTDVATRRYVFQLDAGLTGQARSLVRFAAGNLPWHGVPAAAVHYTGGSYPAVADALMEECEHARSTNTLACALRADLADLAPLVRRLACEGIGLLFFLGPAECEQRFLAECDQQDWHPVFLALGSVPDRRLSGIPSGFAHRVFLAYPVQAPESLAPGRAEFRQLAERCQLNESMRAPAMAALAAAKLLVEGLTRCGHDLSRARLIDRFEQVSGLETGFAPPLTFGSNRHVGVLGADVFAVDMSARKLVRVSAGGEAGEP